MSSEFSKYQDEKLASYRNWAEAHCPKDGRLVHYCGIDCIGAADIAAAQVEERIADLLCEGFFVDWALHGGRVFLRVHEFGGPEPSWEKVFQEASLIDGKIPL